MSKSLRVVLALMMCLPILGGCWNQKELTELAFVMAMGIDKGKTKKFDVSFQIVIPGNVATGQGGGQGVPIAVIESSGNTLTEAARKATKTASRRLYYAHTNLVVVSHKLANSEDILNVIDALDRDPEFRTTTELVVARDSNAKDIVSALTNLDKLPVNKVTKELKTTESMLGENISVDIDEFISGIVSMGKEPILNGYYLAGNKKGARKSESLQKSIPDAFLTANGLAVFRDGKMAGWIENTRARGVVWVLDKAKSTGINVDWEGKQDAINMAPIRSKTKVSVTFKNGKPVIHVKVENEGWISEANTDIDLTDPNVISKIEKRVEKEIKKEILESVKAAQKLKSDIFGFGEKVHKANPPLWKKLKGRWNEQFAELEVTVKVDSYIRREGERTKPFWSDLKK